MNKNIFALLIGINEYAPDSNITSLDGCLNDLMQWEAFLQSRFPAEKRKVASLQNSEATYQNVVDHFGDKHLLNAGKDDLVLIAYSGHGSQELAAPEFERYFPGGKQESMVLYDSRLPGGLDLADKELALLIERIAKKGAHVAVVLDCCHSGSGTKNVSDFMLGKPRQTSGRTEPRPLESYLNGAFLDMGQQLYIPNSRHILLAACDRKEKAYETSSDHGLFSKTMLSILEKTGGRLSYADLFTQCRIEMAKTSDQQHPQFEPSGYFNAYQGFLGLKETELSAPVRVYFENDMWQANVGALHGIPMDETPATFEINHGGKTLGQLVSTSVGTETCTLSEPNFKMSEDTLYEGHLTSIPVPKMAVELRIDPSIDADIKQRLSAYQSVFFMFQDAESTAPYRVEINQKGIQLIRSADMLNVRTISGSLWDKMLEDVLDKLERIGSWEKFMTLDNPNSKINNHGIELILVELDEDGKELRRVVEGEAIITVKDDKQEVPFRIEVWNKNGPQRHCALVYAGPDYGLYPQYNNETPKSENPVFAMDKGSDGKQRFFKVGSGEQQTIDFFKLFVSNKPLTNERLGMLGFIVGDDPVYSPTKSTDKSQDTITKSRIVGGIIEVKPKEDVNDWYALTLKVKTIVKGEKVGREALFMANKKIHFHDHPSFTAEVSMHAIGDAGRSMDDMSIIAALAKSGEFELIRFKGKSRGSAPEDMVELSGFDNEASLADHPLEIDIAEALRHDEEAEEFILPITFDGKNLFPVGETEMLENGKTRVRIKHLPSIVEKRTRNPVKALKLCFIKIALPKRDVNKLCWVDYSGLEPARRSENLYNKVLGAKRILLLIHGIIGDTKGMVEGVHPLVEKGDYDLVLTYDYENLNTRIETTAGLLADKLQEAGIKPAGKKINILAHSMGGLVARYFIENLQGNNVVEHLVMAGTPNGGSRISRLTTYRDYAMPLLAFVVNLPFGMTAAASILAILQPTKIVTPTLEQMDYDNPDNFLKNLAKSSDPAVRYSIVAGNLDWYLAEHKEKLKFKDKLSRTGGKFFYPDQTNDIAVSVDSIKAVPMDRQPVPYVTEVACHHLNYFKEKAGIHPILELLSNKV
ncbi:MAG: caspase family protein [Saprospiraceae bacterium]|nr:caspase family protein [Saprospiraceae bacterium]